jgi:transcription elongation factor GreA
MRTPQRKIGNYAHLRPDHHITEKKYNKLKSEFDKLKNHIRHPLIKEVKRLALMGDFSENAAYQIAKGRLRGVNQRMVDIENLLKRSSIIQTKDNNTVQLGSLVTVEINNKTKEFQILGSTETNPNQGIISHNSPIGKALMNSKIGDEVLIEINNNKLKYQIINIK